MMKRRAVAAVVALPLLATATASAAPGERANASCQGRLSANVAQMQDRDFIAHDVKAWFPGPPGAFFSLVAREPKGSSVAECLD